MNNNHSSKKRWLFLACGMITLLFSGIIYAWSILKSPLNAEFGWSATALSLNYTITMCCFCCGGILGGLLLNKIGIRIPLIVSGILTTAGFSISSRLNGTQIVTLYISYGILAGTGIGIAFNIIVSVISAWFQDKRGLCSGLLMMSFGLSAFITGKLADILIQNPMLGWRTAYFILGCLSGISIIISSLILNMPTQNTAAIDLETCLDQNEYLPFQMVKNRSFILAFVSLVFVAGISNSVISFAKELVISVGATGSLAATLVGLLSLFNGCGRILSGFMFDKLGCWKTMLISGAFTILATLVSLSAIVFHSLPIIVLGLCMTGLSYGTCPTIASTFTLSYFGKKNFAKNFPIMNINLIGASIFASFSTLVMTLTNGFFFPYLLFCIMAFIAFRLFLAISPQ